MLSYHVLPNVKPIRPTKNLQRTLNKTYIDFTYKSTEPNMTRNSLKEAIEKGNCKKYHRKNECWINALYEKYSGNLLNPDKKRCLVTREMIYQTIGKIQKMLGKA